MPVVRLDAVPANRPPVGLWRSAGRRMLRNRMAAAGLVYVAFLALLALFAPLVAPHNPIAGDLRTAGAYRQAAWVDDPNPLYAGTWDHPLGTDAIGRDVLSRVIFGTRVSLVVGFVPLAVVLAIAVPVGLAAGYGPRWLDDALMRLTDAVYAFPALLFFVVAQVSFADTAFGELLGGLVLLFVTLSVVNWTGLARLVRGETLARRRSDYVLAARATGGGSARIVARHILPNVAGTIVVAAAFTVPGAIVAEAVLSYLGIGLRPDVSLDAPFPTSWGRMILDGSSAWQAQPWVLIAPCLALASTTLAFTFVGDGLRDAFDPRGAP